MRNVAIIPTAAIGRVKNIRKLPSDKSNDSLRDLSNMGPRTKARTIGAVSNLYFRIRYPGLLFMEKIIFIFLSMIFLSRKGFKFSSFLERESFTAFWI